jgi:ABC-type branched-subunit amino acid transport system ATPase component
MKAMAILNLHKISKSFNGVKAVNDLSIALKEGKVTSLIGPNGAGKTTVFNLISGFLAPDTGSIYYKDTEISRLRPDKVAKAGISRTFQNLRLFSRITVLDNILLAIREQDGESIWRVFFRPRAVAHEQRENLRKAIALIEFVGLLHARNKLAEELSYGEQKLLGLARAFADDKTELLLLDEPTSGLHTDMVNKMLSLIKRLRDFGKTIFFIEHDISVVLEISDEVIILDNGRKVVQGKTEEIQNNEIAQVYLNSSLRTAEEEFIQ